MVFVFMNAIPGLGFETQWSYPETGAAEILQKAMNAAIPSMFLMVPPFLIERNNVFLICKKALH